MGPPRDLGGYGGLVGGRAAAYFVPAVSDQEADRGSRQPYQPFSIGLISADACVELMRFAARKGHNEK